MSLEWFTYPSNVKIVKLRTSEGFGKMELNNPVPDEEEEATLGPNIWSKEDEDADEAETIFLFFLSMPKLG